MKDTDKQRNYHPHIDKRLHVQRLVTESLESGLSDASPEDIRDRVKEHLSSN